LITFGAPAFLAAGAVAALVPLALHLIRRRPPSRVALPTERFLAPDPRTSVRLGHPTDVVLLVLRMLLLLLAGAALARPVWRPAARGTASVVLLDRGAAMSGGDAWPRAVATARQRLLGPRGEALGALVLFDSAATVVPPGRVTSPLFDSLAAARPASAPGQYAAALRAIPVAVGGLRAADSVRVALVTRPRWSGWSDGLGPLRASILPASLELIDLPDLDSGDDEIQPENVRALEAIYYSAALERISFTSTGLEAAGWRVRRAAPSPGLRDSARLIVVASAVPAGMQDELRRSAESGATVLVTASGSSLRDLVPWTGTMRSERDGGGIWLASGAHASGAAMRVTGDAVRGARVIAAWDDGRPAAAARRLGRGCVVFVATDLDRGEITLDPGYPRLLDGLARGCEASGDAIAPNAPLDAGARAVLRGNGPRVVAARTVPGWGGGVPLGRWAMGLALIVALVETFLAYRRKRPA
jgi:hypothetical protein